MTRERLERTLGKQQGWQASGPGYNYQYGRKLGHMGMFWGGQSDTLHFEIPGQGCRWLEKVHHLTDWTDWAHFLEDILATGARLTRVDFAFDDFEGLVNYQTCIDAAVSGTVVGLRKYQINIDGKTRNGAATGLGITFGGKQSSYRVRIYDKALQLKIESHWTRVEVQARDEPAATLVRAFIENGYLPIISDLSARLSFRDRHPTDKKRSRWKVSGWWGDFLRNIPKHKIPVHLITPTPNQRQQAFVHQWGRFLGELRATPEGRRDLALIEKEADAKFQNYIVSLETPAPPQFGGLQGYRELRAAVSQRAKPIYIRARHLMRR